MSRRIEPSWLVDRSIEDEHGDRCCDLFSRPDGAHGFEEFRRDVENSGAWTAVASYPDAIYASREEAMAAAEKTIPWLHRRIHGKEAPPTSS